METLTFLAKHDYAHAKTGIEIPVKLRVGQSASVRILAKIDTGAYFCIFQREFAEQLGIDVESGERVTVGTPMGQFDVYGHTLTLVWNGTSKPSSISPARIAIHAMWLAEPAGFNIFGWGSSNTMHNYF